MGATKRYFRNQFQRNKLTLDHEDAADFYLANWQTGQSPLPLFCVRLIVFIGCTSILIASFVLTSQHFSPRFWPIFMTHWGLVMIAVTSGCAFLVSCMVLINGPIDYGVMPWYVRLYWLTYSVTVDIAIFITIFFYAILYPMAGDEEFSVNPVLDVFIHGMNSVMMFILLVTARHPLHLLQFLYPFLFAIIYLGFTIIYYYAGGTNPTGEVWIYPVIDWSNPGPAVITVFVVAIFLLILHIIIVGLSCLRDFIVRRYILKTSEFVPYN